MKKIFFLYLLAAVCFIQSNAQTLKPFEDRNGLYGYKDDNGKVVIAPKYVTATYFFEGVDKAWVYLDSKFALINKKGEMIISFKYSYVNFFQEGMAVVAIDTKFMEAGGKYGFVDKNGKEVIPLIYDYAEEFTNGKAKVKKGDKEFFIDKTGKPLN
jgi:WG containing repeat